jgi:hypothetical protein
MHGRHEPHSVPVESFDAEGRLGRLTGVIVVAVVCACTLVQAAVAKPTPRPHISWFDATPQAVPAAGGTVVVRVYVRNARRCAFETQRGATSAVRHLRTVSCSSGRATVRLHVPANRTSRILALRFRVTARNARGQGVSARVEVVQQPRAVPPAPEPLEIQTSSTPSATVGFGYSVALVATGGKRPYTWAVESGSLPPGLALDALGTIAGSAAAAGTWTFEARVADAAGKTATLAYSLTVAAPPPATADIPAYTSSNWSGYILSGGPYTAVTGTFNVPTVSASPTDTSTSEWVGVDGADPSDQDLLQAGVAQDYSADTDRYVTYAWVEELPAAAEPIPLEVEPGDQVTVTISLVATNTWNVYVKNDSTGQAFSIDETYSGRGLSAEWVVEAPTLVSTMSIATVGAFSPVTFTGLGVNPVSGSFASVILVQDGQWVSVPSGLTPTGFTVAHGSVAPAAP